MVSVLFWNINGIVDPIKLKRIRSSWRAYAPQFILILETHLKAKECARLDGGGYKLLVSSSYETHRKRRVAVLVRHSFRHVTMATCQDDEAMLPSGRVGSGGPATLLPPYIGLQLQNIKQSGTKSKL